jgi:predicted DNA-binding transcriptional regulator AlpA
MPYILMRKPDAARYVGLKNSQFDLHVKLGRLPKPITITVGGRRLAWLQHELDAAIEKRMRDR